MYLHINLFILICTNSIFEERKHSPNRYITIHSNRQYFGTIPSNGHIIIKFTTMLLYN